jgi:hypothetical protein
MAAMNGYAAMSRKRKADKAKPKSKRRKMDDYETPEDNTAALCQLVKFAGPILEPASGSGRMSRALAEFTGKKVTTADLKRGADFMARKAPWPGDIITNPPYRDNLPEGFARNALRLASGRVALLVEQKWLTGARRANGLFADFVPEAVIFLASRIYFFEGSGKPIPSQFFSHCWVVWPEAKRRKKLKPGDTRAYIVDQNGAADILRLLGN